MGDPKKDSISPLTYMPQVKVCCTAKEGKRNEQGSGHIFVEFLERSKDLGLIVIDEEDNSTILVHRISCNCAYERQDNTISWKDPDLAIELALDFPVARACSSIWENIQEVQNDLSTRLGIGVEIDSHPTKGPQEETTSLSRVGMAVYSRRVKRSQKATTIVSSSDESFLSENDEASEFPPLELSTLPLILKNILECDDKDRTFVPKYLLRDPEFFQKLVNLFRVCEKSQKMDGLHMIFKLVKAIILLNSSEIFDRILSDEFILDIIGTLEYDPDVPQVQQHHRTFLKEKVIFKEAIHVKDDEALSKLHRSYMIGYLKDVILPDVLDPATKVTLETILNTNNVLVVSLLKDNDSFFQELVSKVRSDNTSAESKKDLVLFLHEFCSLCKYLSLMEQVNLLRNLAAKGVFEITADVLRSHNKKLVPAGIKILFCFLDIIPSALRSYVIQDDATFLGLLVKGLITGLGCDIHDEFLEILQRLVDSKDTPTAQQDRIMHIFCEGYLDELMDVIELCCPPKNGSHRAESNPAYKPESLLNICELLRFCVIHHFNEISFYFYLSNVIKKVLYLTRRRERFLVVAAVRFIRTIISSGADDELVLQHIACHNLLKPVIDVFTENGNRDNMLRSGVLELLEYIWKEDIKVLFAYLIDRFWVQLVKFEHLGTIRALLDKHEESSHKSEPKDTRDTVDVRENKDKSDEGGSARSESQKQDQTAETSKPDATEVDEKAGSTGNADPDNRDDDGNHCSPQAKRTKPPADDEEPSSSSAANRESEGEVSKRRKSF